MQTRGFGGTARFTLPGMEGRRGKGQDKIMAGKLQEEAGNKPGVRSGDEAMGKFDNEEAAKKESGTTVPDEE